MGASMGGIVGASMERSIKSPLKGAALGGGLGALALRREYERDKKKRNEEKKNVNLPSSGTSIMDRY